MDGVVGIEPTPEGSKSSALPLCNTPAEPLFRERDGQNNEGLLPLVARKWLG